MVYDSEDGQWYAKYSAQDASEKLSYQNKILCRPHRRHQIGGGLSAPNERLLRQITRFACLHLAGQL